jgi:1,5-anhydro-D-fructose reductase (1,5-anhydro-D-mannitol-forming)
VIRIGIVGCGRILAAHLRGYRLLREAGVDDFRITALCSLYEDEARMYVQRGAGPPQRPAVSDIPGDPLAVGDEYLSDFQDDVDVEVYTDYREMIASAPIDAVNDFTTHALHHQVADAALGAGKDLMTQKPLAVTVAAARRMCKQADETGRVLGVFENARYKPPTRHVKWLFESGRIGEFQMMMLGNVGTWWSPNRIVAHTPWRHSKVEAGGIALDLGVHQFDLVRCMGGEVKDVTARTAVVEPQRITLDADGAEVERIDCDADDTFYASFATEAGATGTLFASWSGHGEATVYGQGVVFYGSGGRVTGDTVTFDGGETASAAALYADGADAARKEADFPLGLDDAFALTQLDWLNAVRTRGESETSAREGLRDLACAYAIVESAAAGRCIAVDDVLTGAVREYQKPIDEHFGIE